MAEHTALKTEPKDSGAAGWVVALLLSGLQVIVWLSSMSDTTLGTSVVILILLSMLVFPAIGVAFLCRRRPRMRKGFLLGMCVIWGSLIVSAAVLAYLMGTSYQGLGAR